MKRPWITSSPSGLDAVAPDVAVGAADGDVHGVFGTVVAELADGCRRDPCPPPGPRVCLEPSSNSNSIRPEWTKYSSSWRSWA